jgi:hypothetical protein
MHRRDKRFNDMMKTILLQYKKDKPLTGLPACLLIAILMCIMCLIPSSTYAEPDWQVELTVQSGAAYNILNIGADSTATDGYDPLWETDALLGGTIEAYFSHPEWGRIQQKFQRVIGAHNPGSVIEMPLTVNSSLINADFTITWDISSLPQDNPIMLTDDSTSQQVDMRTASSYDFTYSTTRSFHINVTENSTCSRPPARIDRATPAYFASLQDSYNSSSEEEAIKSRAELLTGNLDINMDKSITLTGGYNCSYSSNSNATTTIQGTLTISSGSVTIENIVIE